MFRTIIQIILRNISELNHYSVHSISYCLHLLIVKDNVWPPYSMVWNPNDPDPREVWRVPLEMMICPYLR